MLPSAARQEEDRGQDQGQGPGHEQGHHQGRNPGSDSPAETAAFLMTLRAQGVNDLGILRAMERVSRSRFAPNRYADLARTDVSIPLPCGQTMTPPSVVAAMLGALRVSPGQRVLEVGSGTGYVAALMAEMGAQVVSLERYRSLAIAAHERLSAHGHRGVELHHADGLNATRLLGRFDSVLMNGCVDAVPDSVIQRLPPGGRLVAALRVPMGPRLVVVQRQPDGGVAQSLGAVLRLPPLVAGIAESL
jgi:protein-L-isoaspartate(D-aspartate) O-methyltransferase